MTPTAMPHFQRRRVLRFAVALATLALAGRAGAASLYGDDDLVSPEGMRDPSLFPPPESPVDYPIEPADLSKIPRQFHKQIVPWDRMEEPGTIIVDPVHRHLYLVLETGDHALRYGVGVGRAGFAWSGEAVIGMKRRWPRWVPPEDMVYRDAKAAKWMNGMPGGPENPLGARALYLHAGGEDTLYRIHGTTEPHSIGKAMSSGCIRMLNQDVDDLFLRADIGTRVVVLEEQTGADLYASGIE